jgi:hypothetical protein
MCLNAQIRVRSLFFATFPKAAAGIVELFDMGFQDMLLQLFIQTENMLYQPVI